MKVNIKLKGLPCIYKITNTVNGMIYVGKAKCLVVRNYNYNSSFRQGRRDHINNYLFNAMIKYGFENFTIEPLAFYKIEELAEKELAWILVLKSNNRNVGYNLRLDSSTGMIVSKETSDKIRKNLTAQWANGIRENHSEKLKIAWSKTPERKKLIGKHFTKILTKYKYIVSDTSGDFEVCDYKRLQELKLHRVLTKFWKRKVEETSFKDFYIKRILI